MHTWHGSVPVHRSFLSLQKSHARDTLWSFRRLAPDSGCSPPALAGFAVPAEADAKVTSEPESGERPDGRRFLEREPLVVAVLAGEGWFGLGMVE